MNDFTYDLTAVGQDFVNQLSSMAGLEYEAKEPKFIGEGIWQFTVTARVQDDITFGLVSELNGKYFSGTCSTNEAEKTITVTVEEIDQAQHSTIQSFDYKNNSEIIAALEGLAD